MLRETDTKEADKILTVLTRSEGKVSVIARGARRKNSRIAAASQLLVYSEMTLFQKGNWSILDEASTLELFPGVRQDVELLALGSYFAELTELLSAEDVPAPDVLPLLLNALYALGTLHKNPLQVKAAFELRLLALSGFEPLVEGCAVCGGEGPEARRWQRCAMCWAASRSGCMRFPWSRRLWDGWRMRRKRLPPPSWSGASVHWIFIRVFGSLRDDNDIGD